MRYRCGNCEAGRSGRRMETGQGPARGVVTGTMKCGFVKPLFPGRAGSTNGGALRCLVNQWTRSASRTSSVAMSVATPVVRLKPGKSKIFYGGNMIVLENSVDTVSGDGCEEPGVMATLVDHNEKLIGEHMRPSLLRPLCQRSANSNGAAIFGIRSMQAGAPSTRHHSCAFACSTT